MLGHWDRHQHARLVQLPSIHLKYFARLAGTEIFSAAARRVKKWLSQVSYKGRSGELTVDYDEGFTLKDSQSGSILFNKNFPGKDNFLSLKKRNILIFNFQSSSTAVMMERDCCG